LKEYETQPEKIKDINNAAKFPHLNTEELSVIFINESGKLGKIDEFKNIIFVENIANISLSINNDNNMLDNLNYALSRGGK